MEYKIHIFWVKLEQRKDITCIKRKGETWMKYTSYMDLIKLYSE